MNEKEFLVLILDKVNRLINEISVNGPLIEISAMISDRLNNLRNKSKEICLDSK